MEIKTLSREMLRLMGIGNTAVFTFSNNAQILSARSTIAILSWRDGMKFKTKRLEGTALQVTRIK